MHSVVPLVRAAINNKSRVEAVYALADLLALLISFLPVREKYIIADRIRDIADAAERVDVTIYQSQRNDRGGNT